MIRKSISCALAGLLIVVPVLAFLFMLLGHWEPDFAVIALLIFSFAVGAMWLATEVSEILRGQQQP
jgi:multisubunit Na+/H+ antiporter MnhB subunit